MMSGTHTQKTVTGAIESTPVAPGGPAQRASQGNRHVDRKITPLAPVHADHTIGESVMRAHLAPYNEYSRSLIRSPHRNGAFHERERRARREATRSREARFLDPASGAPVS